MESIALTLGLTNHCTGRARTTAGLSTMTSARRSLWNHQASHVTVQSAIIATSLYFAELNATSDTPIISIPAPRMQNRISILHQRLGLFSMPSPWPRIVKIVNNPPQNRSLNIRRRHFLVPALSSPLRFNIISLRRPTRARRRAHARRRGSSHGILWKNHRRRSN